MQLELFSAKVLLFPAHRDRRLVKKKAHTLIVLGRERGEKNWFAFCRKLDKQMTKAGMSREKVLAEIDRLALAVRAEMYGQRSSSRPGGSAA
ncbi:DUF6074 family protein [Mesorhizobium sp.]|uniref:DUF6074 family protein n=1 Tax=Mesorhizobium sp. TaxID=1871066 RepID=UPI00120C885F|nr:DUF6074 family protein [Mesorhizobium sp.]TIN78337.1 MAG: hypothetical protein E5Y09_13195 [Mesorhizobium sp.]